MSRNGRQIWIYPPTTQNPNVPYKGETILHYVNPHFCGPMENREPSVVTAYFNYTIGESEPIGHDLRGLKLFLDIAVSGCGAGMRPDLKGADSGTAKTIELDFARGTRITTVASTIVARCAYLPFEVGDEAIPTFPKIYVTTWAGLGEQSSATGCSATPRLTRYVVPNEEGVYPPILIPEFARGVYAISSDATKQGAMAIRQKTSAGVADGVVLTETSAPFNDSLSIPIVNGALGLQLVVGGEGAKPKVAVVFNLAL